MIKFTYNQNDNTLIWTLSGRFDTFACGQLSDMILGKIQAMKGSNAQNTLLEASIVFDLKEVDYISSSFFRLSLLAAKQVPEGKFRIIHCSPAIKNVFDIAGLTAALQVS
jgi:anti-anti-sigma factor